MSKVNVGRVQEGGRLAVHKADFNAHVSGESFRQMASTVDISAIEGIVGANVQEALENLNDLITSAGSGFISIGLADGYAQGSYTVGSSGYDNLRDAFNAAQLDPRLTNGGVILVLAGTYRTAATITIKAGITVLGEMGGTIIIGEMPDIPMFQISESTNRITIGGDNGSGDLSLDSGSKPEGVKFVNLMFVDNLDGYASFGAPSMTTVPMIRCSVNSHFTCEQVRFIGRLTAGAPPRTSTYAAIGNSSGSSSGTHLNLYKCFFDGIKVPIRFSAGGGDVDSVVINGCRARVIGLDDNAAEGTSEDNSFLVTTACKASIINNYVYPGPNTYLEALVHVTAVYGDDSIFVITGNYGIGSDVEPSYGALLGSTGSILVKSMQRGNSWSEKLGEWYVVAGHDYTGSGALDIIVSSGLYGGNIVYVYSNQIVTGNGNSSLRLVGVSSAIIDLDVASGTDSFTGNLKFEIHSARNIRFRSDTVNTAFYHTVLAYKHSSNESLHIDNCIFDNCALVVFESTVDSFENLSVTNCQFYQDGDYGCDISLLLPAANNTKVDNCYFNLNGGGYVGGIGDASAYNSAMTNCIISITNCDFNLNGGQLDVDGILSMNHFFWINESTSKVTIDNCKILADDDFSSVAAVSGAVTISKFVYIKARDIFITNSLFNSPMQAFSSLYAMAGLYLEPQASASISNSKFIGGALLLQIGGTTALTATVNSILENGGIVITGCDFVSGDDYSYTVLDVDIDLATEPTRTPPRILIDGNNFRGYAQPAGAETHQAQHLASTGAHYETQGTVQIYANLTDVIVSNNKIRSSMLDIPHNSITEFAGLVVNNSNGDTLSNTRVVSTTVSNNTIYFASDYSDTISMADIGVSALKIKSPVINVNNNFITTYFSGTLDDSYVYCLHLTCEDAVGYGDSIIANNIFSVRNDAGSAGTLRNYYVYVHSSSARGSIVNNSFSNGTINIIGPATSTDLIDDNTGTWYISGNKNQINTLAVTNGTGNYSVASTTASLRLAGFTSSTLASGITGSSTGDTGVTFSYSVTDAGTAITFAWTIPGSALPYGVQVTSAVLSYELADTATTRDLTLSIISDAGTDGTLSAIGGLGAATRTTTAALTHINYPENNLRVAVIATIDDSAANSITISSLAITYKW